MRQKATSTEIKGTMTRKEFDEMTPELTPETRDMLWGMVSDPLNKKWEIEDYGAECSMCGKPMAYRFCGMCTTCEMVWNS